MCTPPVLKHHTNGNANAWIIRIEDEIFAIYVININIVGVVPTIWPRLDKSEPEAAVLEAGISVNHCWTADTKLVSPPEISAEAVIRYATLTSCAESQSRLGTLSGLILRCALRTR